MSQWSDSPIQENSPVSGSRILFSIFAGSSVKKRFLISILITAFCFCGTTAHCFDDDPALSTDGLLLIVCGSATSWIVDNLLNNRRGFHNRLTRQIHLMPFSLNECEALLINNGMVMTKDQIIECYMTFGGIPYYLDLLDHRLSLAQNIDELCFKEYGSLINEYDNLF